MSEPFIGELRLFPYSFAPEGWFYCAGQIISVQQYAALFALIGSTYGGNGTTNFALPNIVGSAVVGVGNDPSDNFDPTWGQTGGNNSVTLTTDMMPSHTHELIGGWDTSNTTEVATPAGNYLSRMVEKASGTAFNTARAYLVDGTKPVTLASGTLAPYGGQGQPHENRQPFLALGWCIAWEGIFPIRP
jgi:microcystin-dependent protein